MPLPKDEAWFPAKTYGWGWGLPSRKEGWLVMGLWLLALVFPGVPIAVWNIAVYVVYVVLASAALTIFLYWKGEEPKWRWGKDS